MRSRPDGTLDLTPAAPRLNTPLAVGSVAAGVGVVLVAVLLEAAWGWEGVSVGILTDAGVALLLVAVLAVLERRLLRDVAALTSGMCTLVGPHASIHSQTGFDGDPIYVCRHEPPHMWLRDTGEAFHG